MVKPNIAMRDTGVTNQFKIEWDQPGNRLLFPWRFSWI